MSQQWRIYGLSDNNRERNHHVVVEHKKTVYNAPQRNRSAPGCPRSERVAFTRAGRAAASAVSLSAKADTNRKERLLWLFVRLCRCSSPNGAGARDETPPPHTHREESLAGSGDGYGGGPPGGR